METKEQSIVITFKATPTFKKKIEKAAAKENRTMSNYIKTVLESALKTTR